MVDYVRISFKINLPIYIVIQYRKNKQYLNDENIYQDAGLRFLKLIK